MVLVDRSIAAKYRHIVLAAVNSEYTVKRLDERAGVIELRVENPQYSHVQFDDGKTLEI